jgi:hypothetical protein
MISDQPMSEDYSGPECPFRIGSMDVQHDPTIEPVQGVVSSSYRVVAYKSDVLGVRLDESGQEWAIWLPDGSRRVFRVTAPPVRDRETGQAYEADGECLHWREE